MQITLSCPIHSSYRVQQIAGMFDVSLAEKAERTLQFEAPPSNTGAGSSGWSIGCIVGPSGSGKSSIARHLFGEHYYTGNDWDNGKAVIDNFGDLPIKEIVRMLTIVGFSSPPSWIKPYSVLSNGEKFRCDLARALLGIRSQETEDRSLETEVRRQETEVRRQETEVRRIVVYDEYTSVVDRNVAKVASAALAKALRGRQETGVSAAACRLLPAAFVAVTCHYDILDWLEPDWVLDTATGEIVLAAPACGAQRRLLRRPNIELEIFRCERSLWSMFKAHHYLSGNLANSCRCYAAVWDGNPVAFCALLPQQGFKRWYRVSRIVMLPDYQGIGIGSALLDSLADLYVQQGFRFSITASHPSVLSHCKRSERWKASHVKTMGSKHSRGRAVVSFEWR